MHRFRFLLIELAVDVRGWWTGPVLPPEADLDELAAWTVYWSYARVALAAEGLMACWIYGFLRSHGQL